MRISDWSSDVCSSDLRAHPHDAVQCAGRLVAMAGTELTVADRQIAVAVQRVVEDLHVAGAIHRLHRIGALLGLGEEHVVLVVVPMPRTLPQAHIEYLWAPHFMVAMVTVGLEIGRASCRERVCQSV